MSHVVINITGSIDPEILGPMLKTVIQDSEWDQDKYLCLFRDRPNQIDYEIALCRGEEREYISQFWGD